jgi:hypothetical protein
MEWLRNAERRAVLLLVGPSQSGKKTYARQLLSPTHDIKDADLALDYRSREQMQELLHESMTRTTQGRPQVLLLHALDASSSSSLAALVDFLSRGYSKPPLIVATCSEKFKIKPILSLCDIRTFRGREATVDKTPFRIVKDLYAAVPNSLAEAASHESGYLDALLFENAPRAVDDLSECLDAMCDKDLEHVKRWKDEDGEDILPLCYGMLGLMQNRARRIPAPLMNIRPADANFFTRYTPEKDAVYKDLVPENPLKQESKRRRQDGEPEGGFGR